MDYETILRSVNEEPTHLFKTARGSAYAQYAGPTTIRNRSAEGHTDKTTGLQPKSGKTIYVPEEHVDDLMRVFRNKSYATELRPLFYDPKSRSGELGIVALDEIKNSFFAPDTPTGGVARKAPFSTVPKVGYSPVEMFGADSAISPKGSSGKGVHWGSAITEVKEVTPKMKGRLGLLAALAGGAGSASAGEIKKAAGEVAESLLPAGLTPSELAPGTLSPEIKAQYAALAQQKKDEVAKAQALLRSGVPMPENYREGGKVKLI